MLILGRSNTLYIEAEGTFDTRVTSLLRAREVLLVLVQSCDDLQLCPNLEFRTHKYQVQRGSRITLSSSVLAGKALGFVLVIDAVAETGVMKRSFVLSGRFL